MEPTKFEGQNVTYAENQYKYIPLPSHRADDGTVTTCWKFSFLERVRVFLGARLYWQQLTFNGPLQPVKATIGVNPVKISKPKPKRFLKFIVKMSDGTEHEIKVRTEKG
jgi:hypothetical protein